MNVNPTQALQLLPVYRQTGLPVMLWGKPGIGKSALVQQAAGPLDVIDVRVAQMDPVDIRGIPFVREGVTAWAPPAFWPRGGEGILFLDELSAAPAGMQAALYELMLDRRLGDYRLPDGWTIVAAGNNVGDGAVAYNQSKALASRMYHLELDVSAKDWLAWAARKGLYPVVQAFINFRKNLLHEFDPRSPDKVFPCPRTWEMLSRLEQAGLPADEEARLLAVASAVGEAAAIEYCAFYRVAASLGNYKETFLHPEKATVPNEIDALYAICGFVAAGATGLNFDKVLTYLERLPAEYAVMTLENIFARLPELQNSPEMPRIVEKYSNVLF